jgi:hypothetical protein
MITLTCTPNPIYVLNREFSFWLQDLKVQTLLQLHIGSAFYIDIGTKQPILKTPSCGDIEK